jgi:hypothetical protein
MCIVILFSRNCRLSLTACPLALLAILKPGFRISLWSTLMPYSFSSSYIFSNFSYKKNVHLQMNIRTGNGTVVNDYPIDFIHITFIYCTEWLFLQSVPVSGCWKLSDFLQLLQSLCHLTFYEYFTITLHGLIKLSLQQFIICCLGCSFGFQVFSILRGSNTCLLNYLFFSVYLGYYLLFLLYKICQL